MNPDRNELIEAICRAWWPNDWPNVPNPQGERDRAELAVIVVENRATHAA